MLTKKVKNRILFLVIAIAIFAISVFYILNSLNENILYFHTPTEISQKAEFVPGEKMRVGGMVKKKSLLTDSKGIKFNITDLKNEIIVTYSGTVPNLFAEGKGVIAEGKLKDKNFFIANRILAKHDENYMPPELEKSLRKNVK